MADISEVCLYLGRLTKEDEGENSISEKAAQCKARRANPVPIERLPWQADNMPVKSPGTRVHDPP